MEAPNKPYVHTLYYSKDGVKPLNVEELVILGTHELLHAKTKRREVKDGDRVIITRGFNRSIVDTKKCSLKREHDKLDDGVTEILNALSRHPEFMEEDAPLAKLHLAISDDAQSLKEIDAGVTKEMAAESLIRIMEVAFTDEVEGIRLLGKYYFSFDSEGFFSEIKKRLPENMQTHFADFEEASRTNNLDGMYNFAHTINLPSSNK